MSKYREDIDGLRSIAVLPVVLFHAGVPGAAGGYVGVDVFFVISGFLITGLLQEDIRNGRYSLVDFYERRIRRIFPALFFLLFCVLVAGAVFFLPDDFKILARTALGALFFASNIVLWRTDDYFATDSELNPLLHTWSLGVEEQFYIFVPVLLYLLARYLPGFTKPVIVACAAISLLICIWATERYESAAFYLLPTRAWELFAGSILALGVIPAVNAPAVRNVLAAAGIGLILFAVTSFSEETLFPGYAALIPVVGTMLVIHCAPGTLAGSILGWRPLVGIGLLSYSLYLWHWPLIVFARHLGYMDAGLSAVALVVILSFVAAYISWRYVEQPFRAKSRFVRPKIFSGAAGGAAVLFAMCVGVFAVGGWPNRFPAEALALENAQSDFSPLREKCHIKGGLRDPAEACVLGDAGTAVAIWGDSHGVEIGYAMSSAGMRVTSYTYSGCPPALNYQRRKRPDCSEHNRVVNAYLKGQEEIATVVLIARYDTYIGSSDFVEGFASTAASMRDAGKRVIIVGPVPFPGWNVPKGLARGWATTFPQEKFDARHAGVLELLQRLENDGFEVVRPDRIFCRDGECTLVVDGGRPILFDDDHPSMAGAHALVSHIDC